MAMYQWGTGACGCLNGSGELRLPDGGAFALEPSPADTGAIRLPNAVAVKARNAADSADLNVLTTDSSDAVLLGGSEVPQLTLAAATVAVSSAALPVPTGEKVLIEDTPAVATAVLDVVATGENSAIWPAIGSAAIRVRRARTAGMPVWGTEMWQVGIELDTHPADQNGIVDGLTILSLDPSAGAGSCFHEGVVFLGNADGAGHDFEHILFTVDSKAWIACANGTAGLPGTPDIVLYTLAFGAGSVAGERSGSIMLDTGDTKAVAPANIVFVPGIDTAVPAGPHATVFTEARSPAQTCYTTRAAAAQTASLSSWQTPAGLPMFSVGPAGEAIHEPGSAAAGASSSRLLFRARTASAALHSWVAMAFGSAAAEVSSLRVLDPAGGNVFELSRNTTTGTSSASFFGGAGASATARPGQLTDSTGGTAGDSLIKCDTTVIDNNFRRLLDRVNALEQKLKDLGLFT